MKFLGNCFGVKIEERENYNPLVTLMVEDDGEWFNKVEFDSAWIDEIMDALQGAKNYIRMKEEK